MIVGFKDVETEKIFSQEISLKLPIDIQKTALRKLIMINNALCINDLRIPPSNRLEKLSGTLSGKWSIRINDQWRICFVPEDDWKNYKEVEIIDYH